MIISASRRTDIPAFYAEWLSRRFRAGFCEVANPFNPRQVSTISLRPEAVDALVLWTRYPAPVMQFLPWFREQGIPVGALVTVVDYPRELEPGMPALEARIRAFHELARELPRGAVVWRYDPAVLSSLSPERFHEDRFAEIARRLEGVTNRVIVSLLADYRSVRTTLARVPGLHLQPDVERARALVGRLAGIARDHGMAVQSCSDPRLAGAPGVDPGGCVGGELLLAAGYGGELPRRARNQRPDCLCLESRDIGAYETCRFGCLYCYATHGTARANANARRHDPHAPALLPTR